jgi:hypothetical protein
MGDGLDAARALDERLAPDYVLVVEWLADEMKTGKSLHDWIEAYPGAPLSSRYVACKSAEDVLVTLRKAAADVATVGTPLVHFECHGFGKQAGGAGGLAIAEGSGERLRWEDLWPELRAINIASGYNLIVVAAACSGDLVSYGALDCFQFVEPLGLDAVQPLPFMASLGFKDSVRPSGVRLSLREFYRALFKCPVIEHAVAAANRELGEGEWLDWLWSGEYAVRAVRELLIGVSPESAAAKLRRENPSMSDAMVSTGVTIIDALSRDLGYQVLSRMLGYGTHPENMQRFPWAMALKEAR